MDNKQQADLREAFRAVGDEFVKACEQADRMARAAFEDVRRTVGSATSRGESRAEEATAGQDPAEAIRTLGGLRDDGLITEEEFQAKKAQLLARI